MQEYPDHKDAAEEAMLADEQVGLCNPQSSGLQEVPNDVKNVLSLFSGCGGMDLGFEGNFLINKHCVDTQNSQGFVAGENDDYYVRLKPNKFQTVFANDILATAQTAWTYNFGERGYAEDIYRTESIVNLVKLHESGVEVFPENIDIVTGGFPCQDFSVAGKRKGFDSSKSHTGEMLAEDSTEETRGQLYYWMKRVIEITQPKIFIAENVKGLVNLANVKEIIQNDFASANGDGYFVFDPQVLHAAKFGVPQSRERVFFIGINKAELNPDVLNMLESGNIPDHLNPYPIPTHSKEQFVELANIFEPLEEPEQSKDVSQQYYSKAKFMGAHCQGQKEINLQGLGPTIRAEHHGNIEFRRLSETNGGKYRKELDDGLQERRLTVRECALIQTFPPNFEFVIPSVVGKRKFLLSASAAYKVIGNAVPPLLAYHLARRIQDVWQEYFND